MLKDAVLSTKVVSVNWLSLVLEINLSGSWIKIIVIGVLMKAIPSILIVILFEYIFLVTDRHLLMLQSMRPWFFCTLKRCKHVIIIWSVMIFLSSDVSWASKSNIDRNKTENAN